MDVALHVGTLLAVLFYFRTDVWKMVTHFMRYCMSGFQKSRLDDETRLAFFLIVATLPAVIIGYTLKKIGLEDIRQMSVIATTSIVFAFVLFVADRISSHKKDMSQMTFKSAFWIGLGQAIALIPGVSRSGICISIGLTLGFTRVASARFAFLMSIPSILGAATLTAYDAIKADYLIVWGDIGLGILFSALTGLAAIHFMLTYLARHTLTIFVIYRVLLGIGIWLLI